MTTHPADLLAVATVLQKMPATIEKTTDIGVHAVDYACAHWSVFPLRGKVPAIPNPHPRGTVARQSCKGECGLDGHGVLDATSDVDRVAAWWGGRFRGSNIGIRVPDNVVVIDVDPRHDGDKSLAALEEKHGPLPETLTAASGRGDGGQHRYFRAPSGRLTSRFLGAGLDVKTAAGYVVAPPSVHPDTGRPYAWTVDAEIADPPGWLTRLLRGPETPHIAQYPQKPSWAPASTSSVWDRFSFLGESIADRYARTHTWADVLQPHDWSCLDPDGDADGARWLHPAATSAVSATVKHGVLFVYTTSTAFEPTETGAPVGYTRFRAYAVLNHGGDLSAAARALRAAEGGALSA